MKMKTTTTTTMVKHLLLLLLLCNLFLFGRCDPAPPQGEWEAWSAWTSCSVTCGKGRCTRSRSCISVVSGGGEDVDVIGDEYISNEEVVCKGPKSQTKICIQQSCATTTTSTTTTTTTTTTTVAPPYQARTTSPPYVPPYNDKYDTKYDTKNDTKYDDKYDTKYDPKHDNKYDADYKPSYSEKKSTWSEWSHWSVPSRSCGSYPVLSTRQRTCTGTKCPGNGKESRPHRLPPCYVNGAWGEWTAWAEPHKTCDSAGPEVVYRERACDSPSPSPGGKNCEGESRDRKDVPLPPCEIDGVWSEWSEWTKPSRSCLDEGQESEKRERTRTCDQPPPSHGGRPCPGEDNEIEEVYLPLCPIDGKWGEWSEWSKPTETCGSDPALVTRTRTCSNPPPKRGGSPCQGPDSETNEVYLPECEIDGGWCEWSQWSKPSKSCGPSTTSRTRECSDPPPSTGGKPCPGSSKETKRANVPPCYWPPSRR